MTRRALPLFPDRVGVNTVLRQSLRTSGVKMSSVTLALSKLRERCVFDLRSPATYCLLYVHKALLVEFPQCSFTLMNEKIDLRTQSVEGLDSSRSISYY